MFCIVLLVEGNRGLFAPVEWPDDGDPSDERAAEPCDRIDCTIFVLKYVDPFNIANTIFIYLSTYLFIYIFIYLFI